MGQEFGPKDFHLRRATDEDVAACDHYVVINKGEMRCRVCGARGSVGVAGFQWLRPPRRMRRKPFSADGRSSGG
jgi:hypothetical protein